ncbi:hypothetical protein [Catenibacterium sp.]|uniref:hypothetical protein n=1 Tax=Catenibacterium sp. TaxID=2049022 RepID=UPI003FD7D900
MNYFTGKPVGDKSIVFYFENVEICFEKQDNWFSIDDGKYILNNFDGNTSITIERTIVEIM